LPLNSGKFSHCLNVSTVAAVTVGTVQTFAYVTKSIQGGPKMAQFFGTP